MLQIHMQCTYIFGEFKGHVGATLWDRRWFILPKIVLYTGHTRTFEKAFLFKIKAFTLRNITIHWLALIMTCKSPLIKTEVNHS